MPQGTEIPTSPRRHDESAPGEVDDEGPGIPDEEAARVFERFYRSSDGGTGLGLAIARWIVDLHGGAIRAESAEPNGCRMVVALPGHGA